MELRIGCVGGGGTGKSSLAEGISVGLNIPFLRSKDITHDILVRDGYDYSSGIQVERFLAHTGRQNELLRKTLEQQSVDAFVTDRTVIDLAAYVICEMNKEEKVVKHIYDTCKKRASLYTHLILCPWLDIPMSDNKKRTLNPWYQLMIHAVERGLMDDWNLSYFILRSTNTQDRTVEALAWLGSQSVAISPDLSSEPHPSSV
jgi:hypothetical protein